MNIKSITMACCMGVLVLTGCARNLSSNTYTESSVAGLVLEGTVVSARQVTIDNSDQLQGNQAGLFAGGATGGIAGSTVGDGKGSALAAVGGAIAGALVGSMIQQELSTSRGVEYIVRLDKDQVDAAENSNVNYTVSRANVENQIRGNIKTNTKSELISIVQGEEQPIGVGQRVFVIYSDDRPRVVPAL